MSREMPELHLPPGLFGGPPEPELTEEEEAAHKALADRAQEIELELRASVRRFETIICRCSFYRDPAEPDRPAQAGCHIHGAVLLAPDGRVV